MGSIMWEDGLEECPCRSDVCDGGEEFKSACLGFLFCSGVELLCFTLSVALGQSSPGCPLRAQTPGRRSLPKFQACCTARCGWNTEPGSACGAGWGSRRSQQKVSRALTSLGCVPAGGGAVEERGHREEEHVPPSRHRVPALRGDVLARRGQAPRAARGEQRPAVRPGGRREPPGQRHRGGDAQRLHRNKYPFLT